MPSKKAAKKAAKKTTQKAARKVTKKIAKRSPPAKSPKGKTSLRSSATKAQRALRADVGAIADAVIAAIDEVTSIEPILADSTLGSLGISTAGQLANLAREINKRVPGANLGKDELKAEMTVRQVIALVLSKLG